METHFLLCRNCEKVLLGIGGGHYVPRHMDIVM
jgi:D-aminoacyl-tRNA deacylase